MQASLHYLLTPASSDAHTDGPELRLSCVRRHFDLCLPSLRFFWQSLRSLPSSGVFTSVTSVMSLAALQEYGDNDGSEDSFLDVWDGTLPPDTPEWQACLHRLICKLHDGDAREAGEPDWSGDERSFILTEEERRGLRRGALEDLICQPYLSHIDVCYYTVGRAAKVEGVLLGMGERLGAWEAFTMFYSKDIQKMTTFTYGEKVNIVETNAIVVRILRGTKAAGKEKVQHCYYVLLKVDGRFQYAALQHVRHDSHRCWIGIDDTVIDHTTYIAWDGNRPTG